MHLARSRAAPRTATSSPRRIDDAPSRLSSLDERGSDRPIPPPRDPPMAYLVHVSPSWERPDGLLWPIALRDPLPRIPIPLDRRDGAAGVDLQALLNRVYDEAAYDLLARYERAPAWPLSQPADAEWAESLRPRR